MKPSGTTVALQTETSSGSRVFTARGSRAAGMPEVVRKLATYTWAWTPASVRPAPVTRTGWPTTEASACSSTSATVTAFFCTCQPW